MSHRRLVWDSVFTKRKQEKTISSKPILFRPILTVSILWFQFFKGIDSFIPIQNRFFPVNRTSLIGAEHGDYC